MAFQFRSRQRGISFIGLVFTAGVLAACGVMAAVLWGGAWLMDGPLSAPGWRYPALAALIAAGMVSYGAAVLAFRAYRLSDLRAAMRRQR